MFLPVSRSPATRLVLLTVLLALVGIVLVPFASYPSPLGSDWAWYRNGIDRLAGGQPIYDQSWLLGPFNYVGPGNVFQFNQAPWLLPIVAPFVLLPEPAAMVGWLVFMDAAVLLALALVIPNRAPVVALVLLQPAVLMSLAWGNIEALVILGVALWIHGQRRELVRLEVIGIVLASLKVVPAIPFGPD